jgi:hypothetical protein
MSKKSHDDICGEWVSKSLLSRSLQGRKWLTVAYWAWSFTWQRVSGAHKTSGLSGVSTRLRVEGVLNVTD